MNSSALNEQWKQLRRNVKRQWTKLIDNELDQIDGSYDQLIGKIQEACGRQRAGFTDAGGC